MDEFTFAILPNHIFQEEQKIDNYTNTIGTVYDFIYWLDSWSFRTNWIRNKMTSATAYRRHFVMFVTNESTLHGASYIMYIKNVCKSELWLEDRTVPDYNRQDVNFFLLLLFFFVDWLTFYSATPKRVHNAAKYIRPNRAVDI